MSHKPLDRRFSIAPMMDWSDRHCRYFWRLISRNAVLYTEMVTTGALLHGDRERFLAFDEAEQPLAIQLGGSDPADLASCTRLAAERGYREVNLNCGCPSDRVQKGMIGACLMEHPKLVADCIKAMQDAAEVEVTVKHRIGVDDMDDYTGLADFVGTVATTGCKTFIVHARKAWLKGLSPKQNREVPPLNYERVYQLKQDFPELEIIINGGITTLKQSQTLLQHVDGVMVGREAYSNPYLLAGVDSQIYANDHVILTREQVLTDFYHYCEREVAKGTRINHMTRHILGLYQGQPGARRFRRYISENAHRPDASAEVLLQALATFAEASTQQP